MVGPTTGICLEIKCCFQYKMNLKKNMNHDHSWVSLIERKLFIKNLNPISYVALLNILNWVEVATQLKKIQVSLNSFHKFPHEFLLKVGWRWHIT